MGKAAFSPFPVFPVLTGSMHYWHFIFRYQSQKCSIKTVRKVGNCTDNTIKCRNSAEKHLKNFRCTWGWIISILDAHKNKYLCFHSGLTHRSLVTVWPFITTRRQHKMNSGYIRSEPCVLTCRGHWSSWPCRTAGSQSRGSSQTVDPAALHTPPPPSAAAKQKHHSSIKTWVLKKRMYTLLQNGVPLHPGTHYSCYQTTYQQDVSINCSTGWRKVRGHHGTSGLMWFCLHPAIPKHFNVMSQHTWKREELLNWSEKVTMWGPFILHVFNHKLETLYIKGWVFLQKQTDLYHNLSSGRPERRH